jgi:hypothetical protein
MEQPATQLLGLAAAVEVVLVLLGAQEQPRLVAMVAQELLMA